MSGAPRDDVAAHVASADDGRGGTRELCQNSRHILLRDMVLPARVGVYPHEHGAAQRVRVNVELQIVDQPAADDLSRTVDYEGLARAVRAIVAAGHVRLVETLAERIAEAGLADRRVTSIRVRVEKLDVFDDIEAVGVELRRCVAGASGKQSTPPVDSQ